MQIEKLNINKSRHYKLLIAKQGYGTKAQTETIVKKQCCFDFRDATRLIKFKTKLISVAIRNLVRTDKGTKKKRL